MPLLLVFLVSWHSIVNTNCLFPYLIHPKHHCIIFAIEPLARDPVDSNCSAKGRILGGGAQWEVLDHVAEALMSGEMPFLQDWLDFP
jgi:hypothetical protein